MPALLRTALALLLPSAVVLTACTAGDPAPPPDDSAMVELQAAADELADLPQGPPGVVMVVQRGADRRVLRAGAADVETEARPGPALHMRIASTAKAYSGAVALSLVDDGVLSLDDTIGERLPWAPDAWTPVTLRQVLHHTSGLPDFSADPEFLDRVRANLAQPLPPRRLLEFVTDQAPEFAPGSAYRYSNSDNVVAALMAAA
ncbi:MAG TPA: serine hydrolase domain-containing protein, partial [Nocardioidaceae bacterium]|nr:serine hydrolase domain-containing protein [Nocardioidaceae bacterium]